MRSRSSSCSVVLAARYHRSGFGLQCLTEPHSQPWSQSLSGSHAQLARANIPIVSCAYSAMLTAVGNLTVFPGCS